MDSSKIDTLPTIEQVIEFSGMFGDQQFNFTKLNKDQKPEFYLGMIAGARVFISYVKHYGKNRDNGETIEMMETRLRMLVSDLSKIVIEKYSLEDFKS